MIITLPNFLNTRLAQSLRGEFDEVYKDPRSTHPQRFAWDHWNLEGQYRLHRTMARQFFSESVYEKLCLALMSYGQKHFGCYSISEPWLSYYTEGDEQHLHTDSPHGPWAYVLSLTNWNKRQFTGGETFMLHENTLNYWQHYDRHRGQERVDLCHEIAPKFNQLLVFDPRIPHGVRPVHGTHDPRQSRLVLHGWFVNPKPFVKGPLEKAKNLKTDLNTAIKKMFSPAVDWDARGILTVRLNVGASGEVRSAKPLTSNLVTSRGAAATSATKYFCSQLKQAKFSKARGSSDITLPIILD